jgi:hypothetical protein
LIGPLWKEEKKELRAQKPPDDAHVEGELEVEPPSPKSKEFQEAASVLAQLLKEQRKELSTRLGSCYESRFYTKLVFK